MTQTTVEWLVNQITTAFIGEIPMYRWYDIRNIIEEAKEKEKKEMRLIYDGLLLEQETWNEIEDDYSKDEYPVFGGPFTNARTPWEWLRDNYNPPVRKDSVEKKKLNLDEVTAMAEKAWEGCDGCDSNDKYFFINGYITAIYGNN